MLTQEQSVEIKVLWRQRMGIRAIARELRDFEDDGRAGWRYLEDPDAGAYGPRAPGRGGV
jgi:hypothetical protein